MCELNKDSSSKIRTLKDRSEIITGIIYTLNRSVQTNPDHDDPGSVVDCWKFLREEIDELISEFSKQMESHALLVNQMHEELEKMKGDSRIQQKPATVFANAPLALIQATEMAKVNLLERLLGLKPSNLPLPMDTKVERLKEEDQVIIYFDDAVQPGGGSWANFTVKMYKGKLRFLQDGFNYENCTEDPLPIEEMADYYIRKKWPLDEDTNKIYIKPKVEKGPAHESQHGMNAGFSE